ncbi:PP2C family protein-serine/threonine phosphatase [Aestuariibius sp. 2305UL40-4]|uniref:PP2C family protein-serine/threonine phosphatase n=1 Tax=Aestuariibius violaceus TaxID=3234132 RepID=UPI00345E7579
MSNGFFTFQTGEATHRGCVRDHNEDALLSLPGSGVWAVADGMGGHQAGDYASQTIVEDLRSVGMPGSAHDLQARFMERLDRAHHRIVEHAMRIGGGTVGATLVALLIFEDAYACVWAGDSRLYLLRGGKLTRVSQDHTEVQELLNSGAITPEEAIHWPRRNVITRAIGVTDPAACDVVSGTLQEGDRFLLCSDGVTEHNRDHDLAAMLSNGFGDPQAVSDAIIQRTLAEGARDNTTAIVVDCYARTEAMVDETTGLWET